MIYRSGKVLFNTRLAGTISEDDNGFTFCYNKEYLKDLDSIAVSLSLPKREEPFKSLTMFPFFDGLIPEGWLLAIAEKSWKIDSRDRLGLLLTCCKDCIGAVSIEIIEEEK
ncbi:MAG: phosphatidylinositol kinase [Candidatus Cloacimonetes bacterium 4572_65]|nr:MAG: phosphatidylinositol kinase [Candidatus Cloacimonetes bacterium 4572_65]